jgi:hypothetical protein
MIVRMWATIRSNDAKPMTRWIRASRSRPKACSNGGSRDISSTCTSSRCADQSPVSRPTEVSPLAQCTRSVTPPSATHQ